MKTYMDEIEEIIQREKAKSYQEGLKKGRSVVEKILVWLQPTNLKNKYLAQVAYWVEKELEALQ